MSIAYVKLEDILFGSHKGLYLHIKLQKDNINVILCIAEEQDTKKLCTLEIYTICEAINVALKMNIPVEFYEV